MKKPISITARKGQADSIAEMVKQVTAYIEKQGVKVDMASLARYVLIAIAVVYGIKKSNILGSLTVSLITGLVTKLLADKLEGEVATAHAEIARS